MQLASEVEIQAAYRGEGVAGAYVAERFLAPLMAMLHERQVAAVNRVLRDNRPQKTLEVAPGPGRITQHVITDGSLTCLDYNEEMIVQGQADSDPKVNWVQGNAFALPFEQEFDCLYSFRFVRHFHRADRSRLYGQFRKVLKAGGWLVVDAVNESVSGPLREARPGDYKIYDKLYKDEQELRKELKEEGFDVARLETVQRAFGWQRRAQVLLGPRNTRLCRWTIQTLEWLSRGPGLEWIVTCRRA